MRAGLVETLEIPTPLPVGPTNVHLIARDPVTLVDAGPLTEEAWQALEAGLRRRKLRVADVERVLLTHGHHDHFGLAGRIADASGARLLGSRLDRRGFHMKRNAKLLLEKMTRAGFGILERFATVAAVTGIDSLAAPLEAWDALDGGEVLAGDGYEIRVRATPGHTPGSLTFEVAGAGLLFTGDTVLHKITPNAVVDEDPERPGETFRSVSRYFESIGTLEAERGPVTYLTGHGRSIPNPRAHFASQRERYRAREESILRSLASGPRCVREIVAELFPRVQTINVYLAYSEVLGFLMHLEDSGRVERRETATRDLFRLAA